MPSPLRAALLLCALTATAVRGQDAPQTEPPAPSEPPNVETTPLPELDDILEDLEQIRGLRFLQEVPSAVQSPEDFRDFVGESLETEWPREQRERQMRGLARLGLVDGGIDLADELSDALMSQAAAYYDPARKTFFYLASDMPPAMLRSTAAHELVHALQDQHFDLTRTFAPLESREPRSDDRVLAARYLVEGEATFVQTVWQLDQLTGGAGNWERSLDTARQTVEKTRDLDLDDLVQMSRAMLAGLPEDSSVRRSIESMDEIPPYVLVPLMDAYMQGAAFVAAVHTEGGWAAVDALYEDLPESSEQCIHPERFVGERDRPTPLTVPELPELVASGWETTDAAVHGELYLRVLLRRQQVPRETALRAAAGWDGDLYHAFEKDDGRTGIVLATTWDTEQDATEFYFAYRDALGTKYPALQELPLTVPGAAQNHGFATGESRHTFGVLVRRGREVFTVEGFTGQLCVPVLRRLLAHPVEHVE